MVPTNPTITTFICIKCASYRKSENNKVYAKQYTGNTRQEIHSTKNFHVKLYFSYLTTLEL